MVKKVENNYVTNKLMHGQTYQKLADRFALRATLTENKNTLQSNYVEKMGKNADFPSFPSFHFSLPPLKKKEVALKSSSLGSENVQLYGRECAK